MHINTLDESQDSYFIILTHSLCSCKVKIILSNKESSYVFYLESIYFNMLVKKVPANFIKNVVQDSVKFARSAFITIF